MNTEIEKIYNLKKEVKYWRTMAARYKSQIEKNNALAENLKITMADVAYLKQMLSEKTAKVSVQEHIEASIGEVYPHFLPSMVQARSRKREIVDLRQTWMCLMYKYSGLSLHNIGQLAGGRDHSTVLHAKYKVENMVITEKAFGIGYEKIVKIMTDKLKSTEN